MLDLFLELRQAVEGGVQDEAEIAGYQPHFRDFLDLELCNGNVDVVPWVYPCLGPIL
jgi:hypothetical protein